MASEPLTLRAQGFWNAFDYVIPLGLIGFALYQLVGATYWGFALVVFGPFLFYGVLRLWNLAVRKAVLTPTRLDYFNGFGWRGIDRAEVKGWRKHSSGGGTWYHLVPKVEGEREVSIPEWLIEHPQAQSWFAGFGDVEKMEAAEADAALVIDPAFGDNDQSRRDTARRLKFYVIAVAAVAGLAAFAGALGWVGPWVLAGVMALPFAAVALNLAYPQHLRLANENGMRDPRPTLLGWLAVPTIACAIIGIDELKLEDGTALLEFALPCTLAAAVYGLVRVPDLRRSAVGMVWAVLLPLAFFWGALALLDVKFDDGPRHTYETTVQSKRESSGRSTTYYLTLAPWSPRNLDPEVSVSWPLYQASPVGATVCVVEGGGLLGIGWYEVQACPHRAVSMA